MQDGERRVRVTVFSDYVCPFCYLEEPDLSRVRARYGEAVEVEWRAYELRPEPVPTLDPDGEYLHTVWDRSVLPMAAALGMELRLPPVQPRSRLALEAAEFARGRGLHDEMHAAIFRAFFRDGRDIGDPEVLAGLGGEVGLGDERVREVLRAGRYTAEVLADERLAARLGVSSVPTMFVGPVEEPLERAEVIVGAQPYGGRIEAAVERARGGDRPVVG